MPDWLGRDCAHRLPLHLPFKNPPFFRKSHPLILIHPSCARNGCTQSHGWGGLPTGKCDIQADLPGNPRKLRKKNQHEQVGTQKRTAQFILARRGQRPRWMGHRTCRRKSRPGKTSMNEEEKKGMREGMDARPGNENKAIGLTSDSSAMNLMIQSPGDGMVPRQCLGKIS